MKNTVLQISFALVFGACVSDTQAATLNLGDQLTINSGVASYDGNGNLVSLLGGSWFSLFNVQTNTKTPLSQGTQGIIIGATQAAGVSTASNNLLPSDWNNIDAPWLLLSSVVTQIGP